MNKVELFENIRKAYFLDKKSIREIATVYKIHRRIVRQAIDSANPPARKKSVRSANCFLTDEMKKIILYWLEQDKTAPKKQRHTAVRIFQRLVTEYHYGGKEPTIRRVVGELRRKIGFSQEAFVPQIYFPAEEAEVDFYEALVIFPQGERKIYFFQMRACYSGREFHFAFFHQTQQAFLEGHIKAFIYFGGVFKNIRYDNLTSAVKKVLKGRKRIETQRFILFRSHYLFNAHFCQPGKRGAHEKGGVECGVGRFRRHFLVPVPVMSTIDELNQYLQESCQADDARRIRGHPHTIKEDWQAEKDLLLPMPKVDFDNDTVSTARVSSKGLVSVDTNHYSVPICWVGCEVETRLSSNQLVCFYQGNQIAQHERLFGRYQSQLILDHYLDVLRIKPGAFAKSVPLSHAKQKGEWPAIYQRYWDELMSCYGTHQGTLFIIDVLFLHRRYSSADVHQAVEWVVALGLKNVDAVELTLREMKGEMNVSAVLSSHCALKKYDSPLPTCQNYDQLLVNSTKRRLH